MSKSQLSGTMAAMLGEIIDHGGVIVCHAMRVWSYPGCPRRERGKPEWYVSSSTVDALVRRKRLEYVQHSKGSRRHPIRARVVQEQTS